MENTCIQTIEDRLLNLKYILEDIIKEIQEERLVNKIQYLQASIQPILVVKAQSSKKTKTSKGKK